MSKVYLPSFTSSNCIVVKDKDTIRLYETLPTLGDSVNYTDYFINSHYLTKSGVELIDSVAACESQDNFTNEIYYRNDFDSICIIFIVFALICIYLPFKIVSRAFGRWLKV